MAAVDAGMQSKAGQLVDVRSRLKALGLSLPTAAKPVALYQPVARCGSLVFVSGQLPFKDGVLMAEGLVPGRVSVEQAQEAARQCVLNALAAIDAELRGQWSAFTRIARVGVYVACDSEMREHARVADGASGLLVDVFGEAGRHARAAVGVAALPLGASVELEVIAQLQDGAPE